MTDAVVQTNEQTPPEGGAVSGEGANGAAPPEPVSNVLEAEGEGAPAPATWPEDWRQRIAGDDPKSFEVARRYASPENFGKAYLALRQQLTSGELIKRLPEDASEEQVAEWRAQMGLPEKPDGYQLPRVIGHEWGEGDKQNLESFIGAAHAANFTQQQLNTALEWYGKQVIAANESRYEADTAAKMKVEDELRVEWGPQFRSNIGLMRRFIETNVPDGGGAALVSARLEDGSRLIDQPWFANWIVEMARDVHGDAAFVGGEAGVAANASRKAAIEKIMREDYNAYAKDKDMQKEYHDIISREERSRR